jgi:protein-S-isoprenylcysteine O-methyltransferase Ste14
MDTRLWLGCVLAVVAGMAEIPTFRSRRLEADDRDESSYGFLAAVTGAAYAVAFAFAGARPWLVAHWPVATLFDLPRASLGAGIACTTAGIALRSWSIKVLGRFFTRQVRVEADQPVIEVGPYRCIRHPSYAGGALAAIGIGLALGSWIGLCALLLALGLGFKRRIDVEERALAETIGVRYQAYMGRTRRLLPFLY